MSTEIYEGANIFAPAWKTDADLNWGEDHAFQVTKRKVEGKGTITDFIASLPMTTSLDGLVTAMTVEPDLPEVNKLINSRDRLVQVAGKKQIVLVLSGLYAGYLAITRANIKKSTDDGHSFQVSVSFTRIETTTSATAQVPASALRAKAKRRAATGKKGGAAKPSAPGGKDVSSLLAKGFDFLTG